MRYDLVATWSSGAYPGGGLWGPRPPGVTKGAPKNKKKERKRREREREEKKRGKERRKQKGEKIDKSIKREGHNSEADLR